MHRILAVVTVLLLSFTSYADESIIARVNGSAITARDLETAVNRLIPQTTYHGSVPEEKRREFREKALDNLIVQELQYQDALARGIKPPKKRVKERMKQIRSRFKSRSAYKAALKEALKAVRKYFLEAAEAARTNKNEIDFKNTAGMEAVLRNLKLTLEMPGRLEKAAGKEISEPAKDAIQEVVKKMKEKLKIAELLTPEKLKELDKLN